MAEQQAKAYFDEAELTIESAEAIYERAKRTGKQLWSKVVKEAYDGTENCVMAALAKEHVDIPRYHPAKTATFISQFKLGGTEMEEVLIKWRRDPDRISQGTFSFPIVACRCFRRTTPVCGLAGYARTSADSVDSSLLTLWQVRGVDAQHC
jgi:hypothetical protein